MKQDKEKKKNNNSQKKQNTKHTYESIRCNKEIT